MKSNVSQGYPGIPQIRTVTCACGNWFDYEGGRARDVLKRAGWTKKVGEFWKCPICSGTSGVSKEQEHDDT